MYTSDTNLRAEILNVFWSIIDAKEDIPDLERLKKELKPKDDLTMTFLLDSLDMVEFYLLLQDRFNFRIPQDDYAYLDTIADIEAYLQQRV